ncbi:MAG: hypothetical protein AB1351_10120, partial [Thermoproteota archaeon]
FRVAPAGDILDEIPNQSTPTHPLGNSGDRLTLRCAVDEGMDYLVTDNIQDFIQGWNLLKSKENINLRLITNNQFVEAILKH